MCLRRSRHNYNRPAFSSAMSETYFIGSKLIAQTTAFKPTLCIYTCTRSEGYKIDTTLTLWLAIVCVEFYKPKWKQVSVWHLEKRILKSQYLYIFKCKCLRGGRIFYLQNYNKKINSRIVCTWNVIFIIQFYPYSVICK